MKNRKPQNRQIGKWKKFNSRNNEKYENEMFFREAIKNIVRNKKYNKTHNRNIIPCSKYENIKFNKRKQDSKNKFNEFCKEHFEKDIENNIRGKVIIQENNRESRSKERSKVQGKRSRSRSIGRNDLSYISTQTFRRNMDDADDIHDKIFNESAKAARDEEDDDKAKTRSKDDDPLRQNLVEYRAKGNWLLPFHKATVDYQATIDIGINNFTATGCVDTGATRLLATTSFCRDHFGADFRKHIKRCCLPTTTDASGSNVTISGFIPVTVKLKDKLEMKYPMVVYEAKHSELLVGYSFLQDARLAVIPGRGIINAPDVEYIRRINFRIPPLELVPTKPHTIPPKAIKIIETKIKFLDGTPINIKNSIIGQQFVTSSEHIEHDLDLNQLSAPFLYDTISADHTIRVLVDNTAASEMKIINEDEIVAHAEFLEPVGGTVEHVKKLITDEITLGMKKPEDGEDISIRTTDAEYRYKTDKNINRFDYVDKINVKMDDKGIEEWTKQLLLDTEDFWSKHDFDHGKFDRKAHIEVADTKPVFDRFRPCHPDKEKAAKLILDQLERNGVIQAANSPYLSQACFVFKKAQDKGGKEAIAGEQDTTDKNRALRLAIDFRKVNQKIASHCHFPIPNIKNILHKLRGAKYISILDLTNSFFQIPLTDVSKRICSFVGAGKQYIFNRLPQGLNISTSVMSEAVSDTLLSGGLASFVEAYVDNIIVISKTKEEHKVHLKKTVETFMKRGWKAKPNKSHVFINTKCRLFGFEVNLENQTIGLDPQKVEGMMKLEHPTTRKEVKSVIGAFQYYSEIVPNLSLWLHPLHEATKPTIPFKWTKQCAINFQKIKRELAKIPYVYMCNFSKPIHVFTDAAQGKSISYHICQLDSIRKRWLPLAWGSHKLSDAQKNFSQPEAELLAIVWAINSQAYFLAWSKIICHTDCRSLTFLLKFAETCAKINRWQLLLNSFNIHFFWEPNSTGGIKIADVMSRQPVKKKINSRPKQEEIDDLPVVNWVGKPMMTLEETKLKLQPLLNRSQPASKERIGRIEEHWSGIEPIEFTDTPFHTERISAAARPTPRERLMNLGMLKEFSNIGKEDVPMEEEELEKLKMKSRRKILSIQAPTILTNWGKNEEDNEEDADEFDINDGHMEEEEDEDVENIRLMRRLNDDTKNDKRMSQKDIGKPGEFYNPADNNHQIPVQRLKKMEMEHQLIPQLRDYTEDVTPAGHLVKLVLQETKDLKVQVLRELQKEDKVFGPIMKTIKKKPGIDKRYIMVQGVLIHIHKVVHHEIERTYYQVCVPKRMAPELVRKFHESVFAQHVHVKKLLQNLNQRFFIKNVQKIATAVIDTCKICQLNKPNTARKQAFGNKLMVNGPRQLICMDICTVDKKILAIDENLPSSFLIILDAWSLYTICVPVQDNITSNEIIHKFTLHYIQSFGLPSLGILTDGAKNFSNRLSNTFCATLGIRKFKISPRHPQSNLAERANRWVLAGMRYLYQQLGHLLEPEMFKNVLSFIVLGWNTTIIASTGFSPYRLFMSTDLDMAAFRSFITIHEAEDRAADGYSSFVEALVKTQVMCEELVNRTNYDERAKRYNKNKERCIKKLFQVGSLVMIQKEPDATKQMHKLRKRWTGPFKIMAQSDTNLVVLPWWESYRTKFTHVYKNEGKKVPQCETFLIHKDRVKPTSSVAWYMNDRMGRAFYSAFWEQVESLEPILEVVPDRTLKHQDHSVAGKNRPTSVVNASMLGLTSHPQLFTANDDIDSINRRFQTTEDLESSDDDDEDDDDDIHVIGIIDAPIIPEDQDDSDSESSNDDVFDDNDNDDDPPNDGIADGGDGSHHSSLSSHHSGGGLEAEPEDIGDIEDIGGAWGQHEPQDGHHRHEVVDTFHQEEDEPVIHETPRNTRKQKETGARSKTTTRTLPPRMAASRFGSYRLSREEDTEGFDARPVRAGSTRGTSATPTRPRRGGSIRTTRPPPGPSTAPPQRSTPSVISITRSRKTNPQSSRPQDNFTEDVLDRGSLSDGATVTITSKARTSRRRTDSSSTRTRAASAASAAALSDATRQINQGFQEALDIIDPDSDEEVKFIFEM